MPAYAFLSCIFMRDQEECILFSKDKNIFLYVHQSILTRMLFIFRAGYLIFVYLQQLPSVNLFFTKTWDCNDVLGSFLHSSNLHLSLSSAVWCMNNNSRCVLKLLTFFAICITQITYLLFYFLLKGDFHLSF